jgi:hypothetical protein
MENIIRISGENGVVSVSDVSFEALVVVVDLSLSSEV